ncbi:MAG: HAD-IC family P-type ATPase [Clostridia bacterium]
MWHTMSVEDVRKNLKTSITYGLKSKEVLKRKKLYGVNRLAKEKKETLMKKFINQFKDFMIIILLVAALISAAISYFQGINDYVDSIIIIAIVVFNAILGVFQEAQAEKSIEALKKMSAPIAKVKRDGKILTIQGIDLVPGDIIVLEAGNFIPADCRLISSYNLKIEESTLTGETQDVEKNANIILNKNIPIGDMINLGFATTIVTNGHAEGIVTNTGMNTKVGKIAHMIISNKSPETPLQKRLSQVGKKLRNWCSFNLFLYIYYRYNKKNIFFRDVYDLCWFSCCRYS